MLKKLLTLVAVMALGAPSVVASQKPGDAPISVDARLDRGLFKAGETQRIYLRIGVTGHRPPKASDRPPMNVALVIDRSGSMQGPRIEAARKAAMAAVERLSPRDIVSVVSYDDRVEVEVPATRATNLSSIKNKIAQLTPRGSTAIWAGMQAGANEVRKFKSREYVNRIILLSDGLANQGPSKPEDFARLGRELAGEGMTVSTIGLGLGYNEDLMAGLAQNADGSHTFVQEPADLVGFLNREFDDVAGIVAQDIEIRIRVSPGLKPMRSLGREARIDGDTIVYSVKQVIGGTDSVVLAEIDLPAANAVGALEVARVDVRYRDADGKEKSSLEQIVRANFGDAAASEKSLDETVMRDVGTLTSRAVRQEAIKLRDAGKHEEAEKKFKSNAEYVKKLQSSMPSSASYEPLQSELKANEAAAAPAARNQAEWDKVRKIQRQYDSNSAGASIKY